MDDSVKFKFILNIRINEDIKEKIRQILSQYSGRFDNESHLVRCAVLNLYNKLKEEAKDGFTKTP